jgi:hypothetical protein
MEVLRQGRGDGHITVQLALNGTLTVPLTVGDEVFWGFPEAQRIEWLKRSARTMLDIYGDARDGRVLSDSEVLERTACGGVA